MACRRSSVQVRSAPRPKFSAGASISLTRHPKLRLKRGQNDGRIYGLALRGSHHEE